jgi:protein-L-isoaspartate(D-aspartate) O-methyltransferase
MGALSALLARAALGGCSPRSSPDPEYERARHEMVQTQLAARDITDPRVLDAFRKVERHLFVAPAWRAQAYEDYPLPIGQGQTISQPYIVALMTQHLHLRGDEKVLEVGTGSGYQAAILSRLARRVFSIELLDSLAACAGERLRNLGYSNVTVRCGDGYAGWPEEAPFDAIVVTCAPTDIPQPLLDQLAEGGRMVIPVGEGFQDLLLVEKKGGAITKTPVAPVRFVPMRGTGVEKK